MTGVVVVTHNSADFIEPCLEAAVERAGQVVVVDNASIDDTCQRVRRFPRVRLIANEDNEGFARAVNQGFELLTGQLVLLLNPDAILQTSLEELEEACLEPEVGAAAGMLLGEDGKPQTGFMVRRFPTAAALGMEALGLNRAWASNPVNRRYRCLGLDLSKPQDVEQPAGAFLMVRREVWEELGGFDERFHPLWFEDVDFLFRLREKGYRTRWAPGVTALHYGAHSLAALPAPKRVWYWYANLLQYAGKHFHPLGFRAVAGSVAVGSVIRMIAGMMSGSGIRSFNGYGKVIRLAVRSIVRGADQVRPSAAFESGLKNTHTHGS
jgi:N-acetylglucosaminyl-diphospho-decaprenol L-rhamnosyltransferase